MEIQFKRRPYTEEARRQHIEGEVLLEILFSSGGEARLVRLIRGLGHGLDQAAVRDHPADKIPPRHNNPGRPVDLVARGAHRI